MARWIPEIAQVVVCEMTAYFEERGSFLITLREGQTIQLNKS